MNASKLASAPLSPAMDLPDAAFDGPHHVPGWVPADVRPRLDLAELARLDRRGVDECRRLEQDLGAFVAAYRRQGHAPPPPGKEQLCSLFEAAPLAPAQLGRIEEAEARVPGVVFVAYASPLRRR